MRSLFTLLLTDAILTTLGYDPIKLGVFIPLLIIAIVSDFILLPSPQSSVAGTGPSDLPGQPKGNGETPSGGGGTGPLSHA